MNVMKKKVLIITMIIVMLLGTISIDAATKVKTTDARYGGENRYETSYLVADALFKANGSFSNVVVAYGGNFPDALSGGYLTRVKNAPLLLVDARREASTLGEIKKIAKAGARVYLLGGEGVVSKTFEKSVKSAGFKVTRLSGPSRYDTNLEILKATVKSGEDLLVASALNYPDSLSGSAVPKGMLLVGSSLREDQKAWLKEKGIKKFYILGGEGAVSKDVAKELKKLGSVVRLGGANRYETSFMIAERFFPETTVVTLAYALNFPDGLSGAPVAMKHNAPILLVSDNKYANAHKYVVDRKITKDYTFGGTGVIAKKTVQAVMEQYEEDRTPTWKWIGNTYAVATFKASYASPYDVVAVITSKVTKNATETETGIRVYTATAKDEFGKEYTDTKTEVIPKLAPHVHKYKSTWSYDKTYHWHECEAGDSVKDKAKHEWSAWMQGKKVCIYCDAEELKENHVHALKKVEKIEPTCTKEGRIAYWECSDCYDKFYDSKGKTQIMKHSDMTLPMKEHDYKFEYTSPATCLQDGYNEYKCTVCKKHKYEGIPKISCAKQGELIEIYDWACGKEGTNNVIHYWKCTECMKAYKDKTGKTELTAGVHKWRPGRLNREGYVAHSGLPAFPFVQDWGYANEMTKELVSKICYHPSGYASYSPSAVYTCKKCGARNYIYGNGVIYPDANDNISVLFRNNVELRRGVGLNDSWYFPLEQMAELAELTPKRMQTLKEIMKKYNIVVTKEDFA